jgi:cytoskeletal protein RodZ
MNNDNNVFANINEKMVKLVDSQKSNLKKFFLIILFIIPILITFIVAKAYFQQDTNDNNEKQKNIVKDKTPDVYGEKNKKETKVINDTEGLDKKLDSMFKSIEK